MRKNAIILLLSFVLAAGRFGTAPVFAVEKTSEESIYIEGENVDEQEKLPEETEKVVIGMTTEAVSDEAIQEEADSLAQCVAKEEEDENAQEEPPTDAVVIEEKAVDVMGDMENTDDEAVEDLEEAEETDEIVIIEESIGTDEKREAEKEGGTVDSGSCGDNVAWSLTGAGDDLTLTFSGSGAMAAFYYDVDAYDWDIPWYDYRNEIKTVVIEDGITSIGSCAFYRCNSLESIAIPDSVSKIGNDAFFDCYNLTNITIPANVTQIGEYAFSSCKGLTRIVIPDRVTRIQMFTFSGCTGLTSITIPNSVKYIGEWAFSRCTGLTSITIPDSVQSIGKRAFSGCTGLISITVPSSVTGIGDDAFYASSMHADVYTVKGSVAEKYFTSLDNGDTITFVFHYPCDTTGHTYGEWVVVIQPTCKTTGLKERTCSGCDLKVTEVIPVTGIHTWNDDYTVDTRPTYDTEGIKSIHCSICNTIKAGSESAVPRTTKPLNLLTISGFENRIYNGREQILDLVVIDGSNVLKEGTDYTVSYGNNTYVGAASVTVTGIGHYTGTYTNTFSILPGASSKVTCTNVASGIKVNWMKVEGATSYYVFRDDKFLFRTSALEVTDKEIKYDTGTKFTYRVIAAAKGVGNSTMSRTTKMFRLMPVGIKSLINSSAGRMTVTYDRCSGCYGYVVRYGLKKDMSDARVIAVKGENTLSRTFAGMKTGKIYYVQVRTYMLEYGIRYYSGYCTTKTIKIKK